jgi:hypothetical protein
MNGLVKHSLGPDMKGTPLMPNTSVPFFIYEAFDESNAPRGQGPVQVRSHHHRG